MLQSIFLWFYCLPIGSAVLCIAAVSAAFRLLCRLFGKKRLWRPAAALLLLAWLVVIAAATLADRIPGSATVQPQLLPFHSYRTVFLGGSRELFRSNFMNVALFFPAGLLACELLPRHWTCRRRLVCVVLLFALVSAGIEFFQYCFAFGQVETDDVIHNTLGAFVGAWICVIPHGLRCGGNRK